jgi:hypothetical protein
MRKIKIATIGGCTGYDILMTNVNWRQKFLLTDVYMGSVSRSYFKPGKIAERLQEEMESLKHTFPSKHKENINRQLKVIFKNETIDSIIRKQAPSTIIMIDPGYELSDYFDDGNESFDIFPYWEDIQEFFPEWFRLKVAQHRYKFDVASPRVEAERDETYLNFFKLLSDQRCLAIFIDNASTEKSYIKKLNSVAVTISAFNSRVSFLTASANGEQTTLNFNYARRLIDRLFRRIKTNKEKYYSGENASKATWFDIDRDMCFADPEHRWGYHPAHLHHTCRVVLCERLHDEIIKLHQQNIVVIDNSKGDPVMDSDKSDKIMGA